MMRRLILKLFRRRRLARDLEAEMAFHREMAAAGGNPIPFGNTGYLKEQALDLWRFNFVENLWRDLVYASRELRRSPGFALTALLSLSLGIGINAAMFSLAVEFLLSEPSVRDAHSLAYVREGGNSHMLPETLEALRRAGVFEEVAGANEETFINFNDGTETRRLFALQATKNYFTALGIPVARGRGWNERDADQVVVLHPHFWRTRLGADPEIVGKSLRLDGRPYTVLGILPDNYRSLIGYGFAPDVFVPRYIQGTILQAYARLKPGMTLGQLNAALPAVTQHISKDNDRDRQLNASPVSGFARLSHQKEAMTVGVFFLILLMVVGLVLLIACVNVAGLLLARASARRHEIAIRLALGASRGRLLQQLLAVSLLLSLGGAALGFALAFFAAKGAAAIPLPVPAPIRLHIDLDWRVVSYAALLAIVSAVASGVMPAWQTVMRRENKTLMRRGLVIAQVAVALLVLTTAALFLRNLLRTSSMGPGFDIRHTVRAEVYLPPAEYKNTAAINAYVQRALERMRAVPGCDGVAAARLIPFTDATRFGSDIVFADTGEKRRTLFNWNAVSPDYFHAMDIAVVRGRPFTGADKAGERVVIVNEEFVHRYLGAREPVETVFRWNNNLNFRIVGVVRGTKNMTIGEDPMPQLYQPLAQIVNDRTRLQFVLRSLTPPATQLAAVREALREAEPAAGLEVQTMFSAIGFAFLPSQVGAVLMGSIGALGLLLAVMGLYGVLAYSVARRTREIGIRVAPGASPKDVSRVVFAELAKLLATGLAIGLAIALFVTRPLAMFFVPGLSPSDPASFGGVVAVLSLTAVLAALAPVRRALRVDPAECLRCE